MYTTQVNATQVNHYRILYRLNVIGFDPVCVLLKGHHLKRSTQKPLFDGTQAQHSFVYNFIYHFVSVQELRYITNCCQSKKDIPPKPPLHSTSAWKNNKREFKKPILITTCQTEQHVSVAIA